MPHAWHDFIRDDAPLALGAPPEIDRLIAFGGGSGVSGGHYTQDMEVAEAGLSAVGAA